MNAASPYESAVEELFSADIEAKKRNVLAQLLDDYLGREGYVLAQRADMGGVESYVATVSLGWIGGNVSLAEQLPLLKSKQDPETGRLIIDADSVELFMQREIHWSRKEELAEYLVKSAVHKFPPILAVITAPWVDDPDSDAWGADGRAVRGVADFQSLDNRRSIGLLNLGSPYVVFALDGQHRKIGIDGALELVRTGRLERLKDNGAAARGEALQLTEILKPAGRQLHEVSGLPSESIGIEIIPAVVAGETREQARLRVRSVFVHVNKQAAPLSPGEIAQLDENNGFAIVARMVSVTHEFLKKKSGRAERVNYKNSTIVGRSTVFTTLQTLTEMTERFLGADDAFSSWKSRGRTLAVRPSDEEREAGLESFAGFLTRLSQLPRVSEIDRGKPTVDLRRFSTENPPGEGHLLFRPIGQIAVAQAVGALHSGKNMTLDSIFDKLRQLDDRGGFRLDDPANVWFGVLYDPQGQRMRVSGRDLAADLLAYLVAGEPKDAERAALLEKLRDARRLDASSNEYRGFDGETVTRDQIKLPPIL